MALAAGGTIAREARWQELWEEAADRGIGLCQLPQEDDRPGACTTRTEAVYCSPHNRRLESRR